MVTYVILHNIRSAYNVGAIFRTADGAGISKVYLTGYTPCPIDRFGRFHAKMEKTALGATRTVAWEYIESVEALISDLKKRDIEVVSVEQHEDADTFAELQIVEARAYILGNEVDGVPQQVLRASDRIVHIPMSGKKESLNVSVAAGIVLFHARLCGTRNSDLYGGQSFRSCREQKSLPI